ncbi:MAG: alginate export family protein [Acidobacteriota bacterium]
MPSKVVLTRIPRRRHCLVGVLWAVLLATATAAKAQLAVGESFTLQRIRGDEDWIGGGDSQVLAEQPWGKAILLGEDAFLSLGAEWRGTFEAFENESWGEVPGSDSYWLNKLMVHGAWTYRPPTGSLEAIRLFAQLEHGEVSGRRSEDRPPDVDRLDWNAAFLELSWRSFAAAKLSLRLGLQELHYGAGRLLAVREGPNTRSTFNAALLRWQSPRWRTDAFYARPYSTAPGTFDNRLLDRQGLWGLYATRQSHDSGHGLELFFFLDQRDAEYFQGAGRERRYSLGARGSLHHKRWEQDLLFVWQWGSWRPLGEMEGGSGRIAAWTLSVQTHYLLQHHPWQPKGHLFFGYASGDGDSGTNDLQAFRAPYPPGRYFGAGTPLGPINVVFYRLGASVESPRGLALGVGFYEFHRESREDGVYGVPGNPLRPPRPDEASRIGYLLEATLSRPLKASLQLELELARFFTSPYLRTEEDTTVFSGRLVWRY